MTRKTIKSALFAATVLAAFIPCLATQAHVSVWPRESMVGATEKYTIRVPTEGKVATSGIELDVPDGVTLETVAVPNNWKYEVKRTGDRIIAVTWQVTVPPGEFVELGFIARNPGAAAKQIVWTMRQKFADGTVQDMTKLADGSIRVPATTKLTSRPAQ